MAEVRELKNFLEVVRNVLDTLLKFGGIWLSSFRDLAFAKFEIFENCGPRRRSKKSIIFHRFFVDFGDVEWLAEAV